MLCSNFVKFVRREIGEIVRCLPDKKNFAWLSSCRCCADRTQNVPGPAPDTVLRVLFRRSYSRTREHHQNAPWSETNIRLKPSFEPNNYWPWQLEHSENRPLLESNALLQRRLVACQHRAWHCWEASLSCSRIHALICLVLSSIRPLP